MRPGLRTRATRGGALAAPIDLAGPSNVYPQPRVASDAELQAGEFQNHWADEVVGEKRARFPSTRQQLLQNTQVILTKLASRKTAAVGRQQKRANPASGNDLPTVHKKKQVGQRAAYHATEYKLGELEELLKKTSAREQWQLQQLIQSGSDDGSGGVDGNGGVLPDRGCGMTVAELESLADLTLGSKRAGTISTYRPQVNKLEWFFKYGHDNEICQEWAQSVLRDRLPVQHLDLCCDDGPSKAQRALRWAGDNFPGYYEAMNQVSSKPNVVIFQF